MFEAGEVGSLGYLLLSGRVRVHLGERTIAILSAGELVGELAALSPAPRSASVSALEDVQMLAIPQRALVNIMYTQPAFAYQTIRMLLTRWERLEQETMQHSIEDQASL